jgi:ribonuclease HII
MKIFPTFDLESELYTLGRARIIGVDEVGRGPLAGPVVAAAVWLDPENIPGGLNDSKKVPLKLRKTLAELLPQIADVSTGQASVQEIDEFNILGASHLAMERAVAGLNMRPDFALVDGNLIPRDLAVPARAVIKGDTISQSIAAASIVAKVRRDQLMLSLAQQYPGYGWDKNQGYPTKAHREALQNLGVTPHHRRSFKPVHNML